MHELLPNKVLEYIQVLELHLRQPSIMTYLLVPDEFFITHISSTKSTIVIYKNGYFTP